MTMDAEAIKKYLLDNGCPQTWEHSQAVALEARDLALRFEVDAEQARQAALLHDISAVIPNARRLECARQWGLEVLPEEAAFPLILHQKLSAALAREVFGVRDEAVLSAIGCHTTLKADYAPLDLTLFVADKLAWDQPGQPPFAAAMRTGLRQGLEHAALVYLDHLWAQRAELLCLHPWMLAAREKIGNQIR